MTADDFFTKHDIQPNIMQRYVIEKLVYTEVNYIRAYIMGGVRSGKSTLVDLIALCHIESYTPMSTPKVVIVTPIVEQQRSHTDGLLEDNPNVKYMTPKADSAFGQADVSLVIFDNIEFIMQRFEKDVDAFDYFMRKCHNMSRGNVVTIGGMSALMINYIIQNINDPQVLCSAWPTWDANPNMSMRSLYDEFNYHRDTADVDLHYGLKLKDRSPLL